MAFRVFTSPLPPFKGGILHVVFLFQKYSLMYFHLFVLQRISNIIVDDFNNHKFLIINNLIIRNKSRVPKSPFEGGQGGCKNDE
jgi:hypothetical protein